MTQEEKSLLLKDLSGRLPYGVKIRSFMADVKLNYDNYSEYIKLNCFRPYLRPISSMTEDEKEEFEQIRYNAEAKLFNALSKGGFTLAFHEIDAWLNSRHFDYRGLIPIGLALEAPKDMYNFNNKEK